MKRVLLLLVVALSSCVRSRDFREIVSEDGKTIVFPDFSSGGSNSTAQGQSIDGVTLRALTVISQDLFPAGDKELPCWEKIDGYDYRVVRQAEITFVYVFLSPARCGRKVLAFDSGVKYAVHVDGRILRRVFEDEPHEHPEELLPDAGVSGAFREPGLPSILQGPTDDPSRHLPPAWLDGGVRLDGGLR
jgi:phosphatidylserine decarboxylase